jgi:four helix bundle protein
MLRSYRELKVWKRSMVLVTDVYRISRSFPPDERFGLTSQLRRAAVSITTNIAEGYGRATRGEYLNHLSVARGSLFEVEALITVSAELSFLTKEELSTLEDHLSQMRAMLRALRNSHPRLTNKSGP